MASEGYLEPITELTDKTRDMHRALMSLREELEAVDWDNQRVDSCKAPELSPFLNIIATKKKSMRQCYLSGFDDEIQTLK